MLTAAGSRFVAGMLLALLCPQLLHTSAAVAGPATPGPDAPLADVRAWIDAGQPVSDPASYHSSDPTSVAFVSPSQKIRCGAGSFYRDKDLQHPIPSLTCEVSLEHPRPAPGEAPATGHLPWLAGWVDYGSTLLNIGEFHSDCNVFCAGYGPALPYGQKISFAQGSASFACRMDEAGLWCANTSGGSAVKLSDQGVDVYGCLVPTRPKYSTGQTYAC